MSTEYFCAFANQIYLLTTNIPLSETDETGLLITFRRDLEGRGRALVSPSLLTRHWLSSVKHFDGSLQNSAACNFLFPGALLCIVPFFLARFRIPLRMLLLLFTFFSLLLPPWHFKLYESKNTTCKVFFFCLKEATLVRLGRSAQRVYPLVGDTWI